MNETYTSMSVHDEMRARVIDLAEEAFHTEGIRSVTMDNIARRLSMSKRTIYQLFTDKEDLLLTCVRKHEKEERDRLRKLGEETDNVLELILMEFANKMKDLEGVKPAFFNELRFYPRVVAHITKCQKRDSAEAVEFLERGIAQGLFREDVNFTIVHAGLQNNIVQVMGDVAFGNYSMAELFANTVMVYMRGCTTVKGAKIMDDFITRYRMGAFRK